MRLPTVVIIALMFLASCVPAWSQEKPWQKEDDACLAARDAAQNCPRKATPIPVRHRTTRKSLVATTSTPAPVTSPLEDRLAALERQNSDFQKSMLSLMADVTTSTNDARKAEAKALETQAEASLKVAETQDKLVPIAQEDADTRRAEQQADARWREYDAKTHRLDVKWGRTNETLRLITDPLGLWLGRTRIQITQDPALTATGGTANATGGTATATNTTSVTDTVTNTNRNENRNTNTNRNENRNTNTNRNENRNTNTNRNDPHRRDP